MTTPNASATHIRLACWRCKSHPGVVYDGTALWCVECAGESGRQTREILNAISDAVRDGLRAWPRCLDRVEFVRECIKLHRESAVQEAGLMPNAHALAALTEAEVVTAWNEYDAVVEAYPGSADLKEAIRKRDAARKKLRALFSRLPVKEE